MPHYGNDTLPAGWVWCSLSDIAYFGGGKTPSMDCKEYWNNGTNLWVTSKDMKSEKINDSLMKITDAALEDMKIYEPGTLLMVTRSGILRRTLPLAILERPATVNQDLKTISILSLCLPEYVYYAIRANESFILKKFHKDGTTVDSINFDKFVNLLLPIPPVEEQKRIVCEIKKWIKQVESIESSQSHFYDIVQAIKAKILDLAISGKLVPQDPSDEPAIDLLKRINPAFKPCDNAHYPYELPAGWILSTFGALNEHKSRSVTPMHEPDKRYELYSVPIFETGKPEFTLGADIGSTKQVVSKGDVLICKINPHLNRVWQVGHHDNELSCIASSEWIVFSNSALVPEFAVLYFQSPLFRNLLTSDVSGVGGSLMRARPSAVNGYPIPIPPLREQERIVKVVSDLMNQISVLSQVM